MTDIQDILQCWKSYFSKFEMFEIPFSTSEIVKASKKLKYWKAPGWDCGSCRTYQI